MKIDPISISVAALGVSIFSLILTFYRAGVDRKLQWEQMRGNMHTRLTIRGVEILTMIEEVRRFPTEEGIKLNQKLVHIAEGIIKIRKSLKNMQVPAPFTASFLVTAVAPIKSDLDDADPIFEELLRAIRASDIPKANKITDGLILRICGSSEEKI